MDRHQVLQALAALVPAVAGALVDQAARELLETFMRAGEEKMRKLAKEANIVSE